jgi:hypothetical protein
MVRRITLAILLAACGDNAEPPELANELTLSFRMEETGDGPRRDAVNGVAIFPWQKLDVGIYMQHGLGTLVVPAVVGNGQHIDGAEGYHFASAHYPVMDHAGGGFTWVGWASVDPETMPYISNQTLLAKWASVPDTQVPPDRREYRLWFEPGLEQWRFEVSRDGLEGDGHSLVVSYPIAIERGRMYFVEASHDAAAATVNLRVSDQTARGELVSVEWDAGVFAGDADLDVGAQNQCADHHLQGTVDALGFWTRTLSDAEQLALGHGGGGIEL